MKDFTVVRRPSAPDPALAPQLDEKPIDPSQRFAAGALAAKSQWQPTAPEVALSRLEEAASVLEAAWEGARPRPQTDQTAPSDRDLWLIENHRLVESVVKDLERQFRALSRQPRRDHTRNLLSIDAAAGYLNASGHQFDEDAVDAYFVAAQRNHPWDLREVWSIKQALQVGLLSELAQAVGEATASQPSSEVAERIRRCYLSLIRIEQTDWNLLYESLSEVERILRGEPTGVYGKMDAESRERYRAAVSHLARRSDRSETEVAAVAVAMAAAALADPVPDSRAAERRGHVGYYLIDDGRALLEEKVGFRPNLRERLMRHLLRRPTGYYLAAVELIALAVIVLLTGGSGDRDPSWVIPLLLLLPSLDTAIAIVNRLVTRLLPPRVPPKLDFSEGVAAGSKTLVAVPTLLLNQAQVDDMVGQLEIRYLANRDPQILFALITDVPDSDREVDENDRLVELCSHRIEALNQRYAEDFRRPFLLLHRRRLYNESEQSWMGWERKRGKLVELNELLLGHSDRFPVKVGDIEQLRDVRYVITLDADTQLPCDAARRLIGAMAHPLNRPVVNAETGIVTEGYTLIQPRIGISVQSATRSRLAAVFSGETGFDIYTRAISETYQDLFGEGIFTGKGIYEVETFEQVLRDRFPTNALLSHDLIEGVHVRCALSSDIELIDDYPSRFDAYVKRKHRWVRGDWQILRWLFSKTPTGRGGWAPNPLSTISRWKIFDNLRRSLQDSAIFTLLVCGWLFLPGGPLFWTVAVLILFALPGYCDLALTLLRLPSMRNRRTMLRRSFEAFAENQMHVFLFLAFLPFQTLLMLDAIARTVRRVYVTRRRLLEWQTAAEAEMGRSRRGPIEKYVDASAWVAVAVAAVIALIRPESLIVAWPLLLLWMLLKPIAQWLDSPPVPVRHSPLPRDETFLRDQALLQWRFFDDNCTSEDNWLIPDSVQESPELVVHRTSPTNIGLLLNARMAALELGFATLPETVEQLEATVATMERMERRHGHLLNWYDTQTLRPAPPYFISTVDSGNLAGCLWALKQGLLEAVERPAVSPQISAGLCDVARTLASTLGDEPDGPASDFQRRFQAAAKGWSDASSKAPDPFDEMLALIELAQVPNPPDGEHHYWRRKVIDRILALRLAVRDLAPWSDSSIQRELLAAGLHLPGDIGATSLSRTQAVVTSLAEEALSAGVPDSLRVHLLQCGRNAAELTGRIQRLASKVDALVRDMNFGALLNRDRKLLAVGYDAVSGVLERSCYDLLASEARMSVFVALANGSVPQETWLRLGRAHVRIGDQCVLASWTGTLFEYLMPLLWMRSYPHTLIDSSVRAVVEVQKRAAATRGTPWGVSEAAYGAQDEQGFFQYHAFGLSSVALKETQPPSQLPRWVVAPYALYLGLQIDPAAALESLQEIERAGWSGRYGLYESIEYERSEGSPIRSWMAHHQGMALVAVCNVLHGYPFRRWFHAEPSVSAVELLLHERIPSTLASEAEQRAA